MKLAPIDAFKVDSLDPGPMSSEGVEKKQYGHFPFPEERMCIVVVNADVDDVR
jgi:hypothetical protein